MCKFPSLLTLLPLHQYVDTLILRIEDFLYLINSLNFYLYAILSCIFRRSKNYTACIIQRYRFLIDILICLFVQLVVNMLIIFKTLHWIILYFVFYSLDVLAYTLNMNLHQNKTALTKKTLTHTDPNNNNLKLNNQIWQKHFHCSHT